MDSLFSFTSTPITIVTILGCISTIGGLTWAIIAFIERIRGAIEIPGWTSSFIFNLLSFGVIMITLGLLGGYLWRTFEASKNRPLYIIEETIRRKNSDT